MTGLFSDFKSNELSEWIEEGTWFFIRPRKIIEKFLAKKPDEIFRESLFFSLIYCCSFLFLSLASVNEWVKYAAINLIILIPILVLFILVTKLFRKSSYSKKVVVYVLGAQFIVTPLLTLIYVSFLVTEDYLYKYVSDILSGVVMIYLVSMFGFAIEANVRKAIKISVACYITFNVVYVILSVLQFDPYSTSPTISRDPIFEEYMNIAKPLNNKETVPTTRMIFVTGAKVFTAFGVHNMITEFQSKSSSEANAIYIKEIDNNIAHLEMILSDVHFARNKKVAQTWLEYYKDIKAEAEFKVKDTAEIKALQLVRYDSIDLGNEIEVYFMRPDISKFIKNQIPLKSYHNQMIHNARNSGNIEDVANIIFFFFGKIADSLVSEFLLHEYEPKPYKETFMEFDE